MGQKTKIGWTDTTWSPLRAKVKMDAAKIARQKGYTSLVNIAEKMAGRVGPHCEHVSEGCKHCYSETGNHRCLPANGTGLPFDRRSRDLIDSIVDEKILMQPLRWKRGRRIFVENQSDLFGEWVTDEAIDRVFAVMALCPQHTFQILTKRPERMAGYVSIMMRIAIKGNSGLPEWFPLPNVHLGVSIENQATADARIPLLLQTPAAKRFVSYEPALGPVDFSAHSIPALWSGGLHQIIIGGESGPGARPFDIQWARNTIKQCRTASVACFVKQLGAKPWDSKSGDVDHLFAHCGHACQCCDDCRPDESGDTPELDDHPKIIKLKSRSGSDPLEWAEDLRVQELIA